ncbi:MAG: IS21-like element helper ATPase IstB [Myxococcales bacterium]|nr:IS21-like element helper ATPase IstB [Myxococcales bacterium]MCG5051465.1 IS21-like element helper ATPase IstB [Myxococcales bacterium]MCG5052842.1 IS21-like element helper ATPase IstB [Myxococcales bacterium]MCG5055438.1 IS21-like element helper ATPase IstB [Myxococcales bacterium]
MLKEQTLDKLRSLRLDAFATTWTEQQKNTEIARLSFDERLGLLVDAECLARENKRLSRLLKEAKLRLSQACIEDIDYSPRREIDKATVRQLASCAWIQQHQNVIVTGMTGTGKTFLACALAQQACRKGFSAIYRRASRLFDELALARADGSYVRLLAKLARADVLVVDDWGLAPAREQERRDFLEVLEDRYGQRSTIMTSQLPPNSWYEHLNDQTMADAILDRLLHNSHRIVLKGPSRRKTTQEIPTE